MRALLINPWVHDFKAFDFWNKPVGLLICASVLKQIGFEIDLIDCMDRLSPYYKTVTKTDTWGRGKYRYEEIEKPKIFSHIPRRYKRYGMPRKTFLDVIERIEIPDCIFVTSTMTYWYRGVFEVVKTVRKRFPDAKIILGGIYATLCTEHARKYSDADMVFTGAIEDRIPELSSVLGLPDMTIAEKKFAPDYSFYDKLHYGVVITSRGCPFDCTYCATRVLSGSFKSITVDEVIEQIDMLRTKTKNIAFFDDALLYNTSFPELLKKIIERKYDLNLHASNGLHCRYITKDIARLMFSANFKTIYLSLETTNPAVQKKTGNKVNTDEFKTAVHLLTSAGFTPNQIHVYLLYGMPGQGYEEIIDAIKLCHDLGTNPHLCEFSPIPHTQEFEKNGLSEDTDPLYHNNLFYTWYYPQPKPHIYRTIKNLLSQHPSQSST
ncbi:MAG: radical SAM protein [candidate division WOR-3 bacterium]|nr:MAG: radical SAM protein [candidate division WOR-3 bacterium]